MSAVSPGLGVLILGNSIFEGVGTALLIPPVYILTTMLFDDLQSRARAFGVISGMGGVGAAAGPLIGGLITSAISWRAAFVFQALIIAVILFLSRPIVDPVPADPTPPFRRRRDGAVSRRLDLRRVRDHADGHERLAHARPGRRRRRCSCSASSTRPRRGARWDRNRCCRPRLFKNRTSNLGLVTQNIQWLLLMGTSFVVSAYLQVVRGYNAIQTGVIFTAATAGILVSSLAAERLAKRYRAADAHHGRLRRHPRRGRRPAHVGEGFTQRVGVRARTPVHRSRRRHDARRRPSTSFSRASPNSSKARSRGCRGACPTSARHSGPPLPARSSCPGSPPAHTGSPCSRSPVWASSDLWPARCCRRTPSCLPRRRRHDPRCHPMRVTTPSAVRSYGRVSGV